MSSSILFLEKNSIPRSSVFFVELKITYQATNYWDLLAGKIELTCRRTREFRFQWREPARATSGNTIVAQVISTLKARLMFSQQATSTMLILSRDNGCTGLTYWPQFWVQVRKRLRETAVRFFGLFVDS